MDQGFFFSSLMISDLSGYLIDGRMYGLRRAGLEWVHSLASLKIGIAFVFFVVFSLCLAYRAFFNDYRYYLGIKIEM